MPKYMYQVAYTSESWATQLGSPQDREQQVGEVVQRLGGRIESFYYAFGDYDLVLIADFPDNESAAAISLAATSGGAVKSIKTTPLMTTSQGMEAMRKAAGAAYRPPGG
jgi:uncharacterized protein with GYD domain